MKRPILQSPKSPKSSLTSSMSRCDAANVKQGKGLSEKVEICWTSFMKVTCSVIQIPTVFGFACGVRGP